MEIRLISADSELYKLCRELLAEFPEHQCMLAVSAPGAILPDADLYIWDAHPDRSVSKEITFSPLKHLFLVQRKNLPAFRESMGGAEVNILLKPVTHAALLAFMGLAISAYEDRVLTASSLRADRNEILQCLIQANLKLQEYDLDRTNFLTRAVHDFRAPLTALNGYCGLLLSEPFGPLNENQREVIRRMQHSAKRLARMANAMFQLSIGRRIKQRPELKRNDIRECIEQAIHEVSPFADEKGLTISVDIGLEPPPLYFEADQIEQALVNLLDNACKFTPKGGSIEIRGYPCFRERRDTRHAGAFNFERRRQNSEAPNSYRIDICDSGMPIQQGLLDLIFEEYTSYAGSQDRSGGGLGLAICKLVISQHHGRIWAENTENGPMFSFTLPLHHPVETVNDTRLVEKPVYSEVM